MRIFKTTSLTFILLLVSISILVAEEAKVIEPQFTENPQSSISTTQTSAENCIQFFTIRGGFLPAVACGYRVQKNLLGFEIASEVDCPLVFIAVSAKATLLQYVCHENFNRQWYAGFGGGVVWMGGMCCKNDRFGPEMHIVFGKKISRKTYWQFELALLDMLDKRDGFFPYPTLSLGFGF